MLKLHFPIRAISKDNEKIFNRQGRVFTSKKFKDFENTLKAYAIEQLPSNFEMLVDELDVYIEYRFKNKVHADCSNLPKSTLDAFNRMIWKDDRQIKTIRIDVVEDAEIESIEMTVTKKPTKGQVLS